MNEQVDMSLVVGILITMVIHDIFFFLISA